MSARGRTLNAWTNGIARLSLMRPRSVSSARTRASSTLSASAAYASRTTCTHAFCQSGKLDATKIRTDLSFFGSYVASVRFPLFIFLSSASSASRKSLTVVRTYAPASRIVLSGVDVGVGHRAFCTVLGSLSTSLHTCSEKWGAMGQMSRAEMRIQYWTRSACIPTSPVTSRYQSRAVWSS